MTQEVARVDGIDELKAKMRAGLGVPEGVTHFLDSWRFFIEKEAKGNAPVWQGHLRRDIASERDRHKIPLWAKVGTNVPYAKPMEYGTGLLSDAPDSSHRRYFPPPDALAPWAKSKGLDPFLVARGIWKRGGTKPRRFLRDAVDASQPHTRAWLSEAVAIIERTAPHAH